MDIRAEKESLIAKLADIQDIRVIQTIKNYLSEIAESTIGYDPNGDIITSSSLITRAKSSNEDISVGRTKSVSKLREEAQNW